MKKKNNLLNKTLAFLLSCGMLLAMAGCGSSASSSASSTASSASASTAQSSSQSADETASGEKLRIGLVQLMDHPSLNEIRDSFIAGMAELGYDESKVEYDLQNGQNDPTILNSIAQKFVGDDVDLIVAIATPAAQSMAAATSDIPILFSAITDPVYAGLVQSLDAPGGNITGTSDAIPVESIFQLADELTPGIQSYGLLYNAGESNSQSVIAQVKEYLDSKSIAYTEATVTNSSEVQQAALNLVTQCDAIFSPIDNTVASAMPALATVAIENGKPVYVAADSMVNDGGLATVGISYTNLGKETAEMAVEILEGGDPATIPVRTLSEFSRVINPDTAAALGITVTE
ncbi:ABC transporter substrate-binding protein [Angelakisella massiliensis]|uniref:ABC transporter substrate-binding protein n=1 Tax=Angelakisella massiliensis TaxID=1871018 RepID=UPI0024B1E247|nr:ABC transporter substrate-binding protein [Angelakisella massiliensis]